MRRDFCAISDDNYVFQTVAFHRSLLRHNPEAHLTVFCFGEEARRLLDGLGLSNLDTVSLGELESFDPELLAVKEKRQPVEYIWTTPPSVSLYMLERGSTQVTYSDADHLFFSSAGPIFEEMGNDSVALMPHRFAPQHRYQAVYSIYNGGFFSVRGDERGLEAMRWWRERCLEWCYNRLEDGKIGNQKYLEEIPRRFEGVHVIAHKGAGLAPWNVDQYRINKENGRLMVDEVPLIFFHYHRLRLRAEGPHDWRPPWYPVSPRNRELIYRPYLEQLDAAIETVRALDPDFSSGLQPRPSLVARLRNGILVAVWWMNAKLRGRLARFLRVARA